MIRRCHNCYEYHGRIPNAYQHIHAFPERGFADLSFFEGPPEDAGVVEHGAADDEGVPKMHAWHGGEGVDVVATHPDTRRVVVADGVKKAVFWRKKTGRHAGIYGEGHEGEEICKSEGAADDGESGVRGSNVVIPGYEAYGARDVNESVCAIEDGEGGLVSGHEPMLNAVLGQGEKEAERTELFKFEDSQTVGFGDIPDRFGKDLL